MSTIELGEMPTAGDDHGAPIGSARLDRRLVRQIALAVAVVLCAVTLTGSEVPRVHGLRPVWSVPIAEAQGTSLNRDTLFVYRTADSITTIAAHELTTGAVRWRRTINGAIGYVQPADAAGMLLIPTEGHLLKLPSANDGSAFHAEVHGATIALSAATGEELWRTAGEPYTVAGDTALMTEFSTGAALRRLRLIRLGDRSTIWSRDTAGVRSYLSLPMTARPDKVVTATDFGQVKIYSYASGALLSSATIPWVASRPEEGFFNDISGTADVLVVNRSQAQQFDMTVYRTDTMAELWRTSQTNGYAFECGTGLCLSQGEAVVAYDPATGARRWRLDGVVTAWQLSADRVVTGAGAEIGPMQLVDAGTGRVVGEPVEGSLASDETAGDGPGRSVLVLRPTTSPPGRTAVTRWDLDTGRHWLLGTIAPVAGPPCAVRPGYLVCDRGDSFEVIAIG